jgi:peptidoglycan hydrolase-like protein with peptidoglycan-binding domain
MSSRILLTAGVAIALAGFGFGQNPSQAPSGTSQTSSEASQQSSPSGTPQTLPETSQQSSPSGTSQIPSGTKVTERQTTTIVQPKKATVSVSNSVVKDAQRKLNAAGYDAGPVDGILGPQTSAALLRYQQAQKLQPTGTLDRQTMGSLRIGGTDQVVAGATDLGRGGKAFAHNAYEGHPVAAGKAIGTGSKDFGKSVAGGTEALAIKAKDKVASGISTVGTSLTHFGHKAEKAGQPPSAASSNSGEQNSNSAQNSDGAQNSAPSANAGENTNNSTGTTATTTQTTTTESTTTTKQQPTQQENSPQQENNSQQENNPQPQQK